MKLLLYCTKGKPYLLDLRNEFENIKFDVFNGKEALNTGWRILNGKIVAECDYEVEKITTTRFNHSTEDYDLIYETETLSYDELLEQSCLDNNELDDYLQAENGYAIHIKNLHIFDKPKELREYLTCKGKYEINNFHAISKAPQNMIYAFKCIFKPFDRRLERYVLISIQPQWLCKILNGEKTIEVRKKVLKEMVENESN